MNTVTCLLNKNQIEKLRQTFADALVDTPPAYALYQLKVENCTITAYTSNKVVFQGKEAEIYAAAFQSVPSFEAHGGSDEVGTGDYFGPVCVCACIVTEKDKALLDQLKVRDSKQMTDKDMIVIGPQLMQQLQHSLLIVDNPKYNRIHKTCNLNQIKAMLHNQAYLNLINKGFSLPPLVVIDQFTPEVSYYRYLQKEKKIVQGLHFETKAENKYTAVACASIIARYGFLKYWEAMEQQHQMSFTKGAGSKVDKDGVTFVQRYGFDKLGQVAKLHFKNTTNIQNTIQE